MWLTSSPRSDSPKPPALSRHWVWKEWLQGKTTQLLAPWRAWQQELQEVRGPARPLAFLATRRRTREARSSCTSWRDDSSSCTSYLQELSARKEPGLSLT